HCREAHSQPPALNHNCRRCTDCHHPLQGRLPLRRLQPHHIILRHCTHHRQHNSCQQVPGRAAPLLQNRNYLPCTGFHHQWQVLSPPDNCPLRRKILCHYTHYHRCIGHLERAARNWSAL